MFGSVIGLNMRLRGSPIRAIGSLAVTVQNQAMLGERKLVAGSNLALMLLDHFIVELFDMSAMDADNMVMVFALIQLEHRLTTLEVMPFDQPRRLELGQHAVDCRQTDFLTRRNQTAIDILGSQMLVLLILQHIKDFHPWQRDFETCLFEIFGRQTYIPLLWPCTHKVHYHYTASPHDPQKMSKSAVFFVFFLLAGCSSAVPSFYKLDVRQGNYIDPANVERLQIGMSKRQVQFLLGTPLLNDPFHQQRWDYLYSFRPEGGDETDKRHISLYFEGDTLARIEGNVTPPPATPSS